ncbi:MAG: hypothetical protein K8S14_05320, partial [Actinomycetia bacterium]|nr:hypothetical protein [Actinomycetes bacterium]
MLNVSPRDLQQQMRRLSRRVRKPIRRDEPSAAPASAAQAQSQHERQILEVLLNRPDLFDNAAERIDPPDFTDPNFRAIAECFWAMAQNGDVPVEQFVARQEMAEFGPLLTELITNGEDRENYEQTLNEAVEFIMYKRNRDQIRKLKSVSLDDETLRKIGEHHRQADPRRMPGIS